ncbi:DUF3168 domain-containing protein [Pacificoceanicola onchidii]|uniref:DUF3168 domain-containing protein n=1 Tax=Pacificoceanicola onchidii TaxID=2562685 RepID=UPI0010A469CC|nr:DUF3168 domain-containing protein [Pacificoceanicola onchidii]
MASPDTEFQKAMYDALKGSPEVMALVDDVYDDLRLGGQQGFSDAPFGSSDGYISFGPEVAVPDDAECIDMDEISIQIDVWSRKVGRVHCKAICSAVRKVLKDVVFDLPTHGHVTTDLDLQRILPDPDNAITHGVLQFTAHIEER